MAILAKDWAIEFAGMLKVEQQPEHEEMVKLSCTTMIYQIADNFRDGEFRDEILSEFLKENSAKPKIPK